MKYLTNMIPKHCIKEFKRRFSYYPTLISIHPEVIKVDINKFLSKSLTIWTNERIDGYGEKQIIERFLEYDSSGIMVYIKEDKDIFILTTTDRKSVADFIISNLKKQ